MKKLLPLLIFTGLLFNSQKTKAQVNATDSLALVDIYKNLGGPTWTNQSGWLAGPIKNWFGVGVQWSYDNQGNIVSGRVNTLDLRSNHLNGTIPTSIGNLSELTFLVFFNDTLITGNIPSSLGNLTKLTYLFMAGNRLAGTVPTSIGNLKALTSLYLEDNKLSGTIPTEISNLTKLTNLYLEGNQFNGSIPDWIGYNLTNLQHLDLSFNQLSGSIPSSLGSLQNLLILSFYSNKLSGIIPPELGSMNKIQEIWLSFNNLTGSIPMALGSLKTTLKKLILDNNKINGVIPDEIGNLLPIQNLTLQNNQLMGSIPKTFDNLSNLTTLNLSSNQLSGPIPQKIGLFPNLVSLDISNNKFVIDKGMENIATRSFAVYSPQDSIPINVQNIGIGAYKFSTSAYFSMPFGFDLSDNVYGDTKFNWYKNGLLDSISGWGNIDSSYIPTSQNSGETINYWAVVYDSLCPKLKLYSKHNTTSPVFPILPSNDSLYLTRLYASTNGTNWTNQTNWRVPGKPISSWYGIITNVNGRVTSISLPNNNLTGTIPDTDSVGAITYLQTLNLPNNAITGGLQQTLGNLAYLQTLNFGSNKFTGSIPNSFGSLANLTSLTLNFNSLSGIIPPSLGNLTKLTVLDMWVNQFSGSIPSELGNLANLTSIWLNWNQLSGSIPTSFGNLTKLKELHLDNNLLNGTLPSQLTNYAQLTGLTLGTNQFTFDGLEPIVQKYAFTTYTPQANIGIASNNGTLAINAGGTLAKNTYKWYQNGNLVATNTGNASFTPTASGNYYATITNSIATALTLTSNTITIAIAPPVINNDSLVLVKLYNSTNGDNWTKKTNWRMPGKLIGTWYGITTNAAGRVTDINLGYNNLTGTLPDADSLNTLTALQTITLGGGNTITGNLPNSLGSLTNLTSIVLDGNAWSGTIPASYGNLINLQLFSASGQGKSKLNGPIPSTFGNLTNLQELWLDGNYFNGSLPASLANFTKLDGTAFKLESNAIIFDGLEAIVKKYPFATYSPQANIPISNNSIKLSVTAGGTLANNTYKWYQNGSLVKTITGDSTYTATTSGTYYCTVTNSIATALTLTSTSAAVSIAVSCTPTATITAFGTVCKSNNYTLSATGTNIGAVPSYQWYKNGNPISGGITGIISNQGFAQGDSISCEIISSDPCAYGHPRPTASYIINYQNNFVTTLTANPSGNIVAGTSVIFTGAASGGVLGIYTYAFNVNGIQKASGQTGGNAFIYTTTSLANGDVVTCTTIKGILENPCGSVSTSNSITMSVFTCTTPVISPSGTKTICSGSSVTLSATGSGSYQWYKDGISISGATNATYTTSSGGAYTVTTTSANCNNTSAATTIIMETPTVPSIAALDLNPMCGGLPNPHTRIQSSAANGYQWFLAGAMVQGATGQIYDVKITAQGDYTVTTTSVNGCQATSLPLKVYDTKLPTPIITASGGTSFCSGNGASVSLTASIASGTAFGYHWYQGGNEVPGITNFPTSITLGVPELSGNYAVKALDREGCPSDASAAISVTINRTPNPVISPSGTKAICSGDNLVLTAIGGGTYLWYKDNTAISSATNSTYITNAAGSYTVMAANGSCTATAAATVVTLQSPPAKPVISFDGTTLSSTVGSSYQWFLNNVAISGATSQTFVPTQSGDYMIQVISVGCSTSLYSDVYHVNNAKLVLSLFPNPVGNYYSLTKNISIIYTLDVSVYTATGVSTGINYTMPPSSSNIYKLATSILAPGMYYVKIYDPVTGETQTISFVKL